MDKTAAIKTTPAIPVLDSLRAFASLSVCLFHFVCTVIGFTSNALLLSVFSYGVYGVHMFFVISGFIIPWSMYHSGYRIKHFFVFTAKRLIRLEPPYIVSLVIAVMIAYARNYGPYYNGVDVAPSLKQILLHFGYLIPFFEGMKWIRSVYWTLAIEFQYYICIGLIFSFMVRREVLIRLVIYALFILAPLISKETFLPYYLPLFLLGILVFLLKTKIIGSPEFALSALLSCVSIFYFHDIATLVFSAVTAAIILFFQDLKSRIGDFLGKISYSIYLFHGIVGLTLLNYAVHITHSGLTRFLALLGVLGITIVFSYLIYRFIEKPSKRISSGIKYKRT